MKTFSSLSARRDLLGLCLIVALTTACTFDASQLRRLPDAAFDLSSAVADGVADTSGQVDASHSDTAGSPDAGGIAVSDAQPDGSTAIAPDVGPPHDAVGELNVDRALTLPDGMAPSSDGLAESLDGPTQIQDAFVDSIDAPMNGDGAPVLPDGTAPGSDAASQSPDGPGLAPDLPAPLAQGSPCQVDGACRSGFCADGFCCNEECLGICRSCKTTPGVCVNSGFGMSVPVDPDGECGAYWCGSSSLGCASSCANDTYCKSTFYCSGSKCIPRKPTGSSCQSDSQCLINTLCVTGICTSLVFGGHTYTLVKSTKSWTGARDSCAQQGSHLAVIDSSAENTWIAGIVNGSDAGRTWIGLSMSASTGTWTWVGQAQPSYRNWGSGEPSGDGLCVETDGGGDWNDLACDNPCSFLCEQP